MPPAPLPALRCQRLPRCHSDHRGWAGPRRPRWATLRAESREVSPGRVVWARGSQGVSLAAPVAQRWNEPEDQAAWAGSRAGRRGLARQAINTLGFPSVHLSARQAPSRRAAASGARQASGDGPPPPERLRTEYSASSTCTVTVYIIRLGFRYLIFKKPILLVFYMKKMLRS